MKRIFLLLALAAGLTALLSGCAAYSNQGNVGGLEGLNGRVDYSDIEDIGPIKSGTLKLFSTQPDTLNPILTKNRYVSEFLGLVFEGLVKVGKDQRPAPALSESWECSEDGKVWTFRLRKDVFWHDGSPFTPEDVKFTIEVIQNPALDSVYKANVRNIEKCETVGDGAVRVYLKKPDSLIPGLMSFPILKKEYFKGIDILDRSSSPNMHPVGTGPYRFLSYSQGESVELVVNNNWWNRGVQDNTAAVPYIPSISVRIFRDAKTAKQALGMGEIDLYFHEGAETNREGLSESFLVRRFPGRNFECIAFNLDDPILSDKHVRKAIAYAIDRSWIVENILGGEAFIADFPVHPNSWVLEGTEFRIYDENREKATEELEAAGWKKEDGVYRKSIGGRMRRLELELIVSKDNEIRCKVAKEIGAQLKELGIELKIKEVSKDTLLKEVNSGNYEMALIGYRLALVPDLTFAYSSDEANYGKNVAGYRNELVDGFLSGIQLSRDEKEMKMLYAQVLDVIEDEVPYAGLYFNAEYTLYNRRIKGKIEANVWNRYDGLTSWYVLGEDQISN